MKVTRIFHFDAAHHLTNYKGACEKQHGHTYRLEVTVQGRIRRDGLALDFAELKNVVHKKVISKVDHTDLNASFKNPSAENIAVWIWKQLCHIGEDTGAAVKLVAVRLWEGENTSVTYEGD